MRHGVGPVRRHSCHKWRHRGGCVGWPGLERSSSDPPRVAAVPLAGAKAPGGGWLCRLGRDGSVPGPSRVAEAPSRRGGLARAASVRTVAFLAHCGKPRCLRALPGKDRAGWFIAVQQPPPRAGPTPLPQAVQPVEAIREKSKFARVVKGVDLRSTAGGCAWVQTPQLARQRPMLLGQTDLCALGPLQLSPFHPAPWVASRVSGKAL